MGRQVRERNIESVILLMEILQSFSFNILPNGFDPKSRQVMAKYAHEKKLRNTFNIAKVRDNIKGELDSLEAVKFSST